MKISLPPHAPLRLLTKTVALAVGIFEITSTISLFGNYLSYEMSNGLLNGDGMHSNALMLEQMETVQALILYAGIAVLFSFVFASASISIWTHLAMKRIRGTGLDTTVSPGWSVGWYFIPIASFWMPFRGMAQIWRGAIYRTPLSNMQLPWLMRSWWACWVIGVACLSGALLVTAQMGASSSFEAIRDRNLLVMASTTLHMASALILIRLIERISQALEGDPSSTFD